MVTLAALIPFIPGMTLTIAMTELATRHLVSGSARLAGALLVFVTLGFGVGLGNRLVSLGLDVGVASVPTAASMASLVAHDTLSGVQAAFTMTLVAIALVTGLLVANVVVPPRRLT